MPESGEKPLSELRSFIVQGSEQKRKPERDDGQRRATREEVEIDGRESFFVLRLRWSKWMLRWIGWLIVFNVLLTIWVGTGTAKFDDKEWFLTLITAETFLQIVGLGYVAVRYLFSSGQSDNSD